jgi:Fe-S-cluster containining protein
MTTIPLRTAGQIALCATSGCGYRCCEFQQGNYIVLYPGELEEAVAKGPSTAHLRVIATESGGYRAVCTARDTATCDAGYKPLDCQSYPFFPVLHADRDEVDVMIKGRKCPLQVAEIREHKAWVGAVWNEAVSARPEIAQWLRQVRLVGYDRVPEKRVPEKLAPEKLAPEM